MEMVEITMLKSDRGAPEGHTVFDYAEDATVSVPKDLADAFISTGSAKLAGQEDDKPADGHADGFDIAKGPGGRWFITDKGDLQKPGYATEDEALAALAELRKPTDGAAQ